MGSSRHIYENSDSGGGGGGGEKHFLSSFHNTYFAPVV
jgi:hypothetical protein